MSDAKEQLIRKHFERMKQIRKRSVALTAGLAKFNVECIMYNGNMTLHPKVKLPQESIDRLKESITDGREEEDA